MSALGLTSHSTGPARKAAQADEFKRYASFTLSEDQTCPKE